MFESINIMSSNFPEKSEWSDQIQVEKIELRNEKREFEYPGIPVNINMGGKLFQIIDTRENEDYNADFLLIDETFNQYFPKEGFKGIRKDEPVVIGRLYPWRFNNLPNTVSRVHAKIEFKNGKIIIEDLNSTNGTTIEIPRIISKESKEMNFSRNTENDINEFKNFIKENEDELNLQYLAFRENIENLGCIFYSKFYNQPKIPYNKIREKIDSEIKTLLGGLNNQNIKINEEHYYWLFCKVNKGIEKFDSSGKNLKIGRFYLNIDPIKIPEVFAKITKIAQEKKVNLEIKTTKNYGGSSNRIDKIIIYFSETESEKILEILENIYKENHSSFIPETPKFTAQLKTKHGEIMKGISFGEEPIFWGESFGTIRAKILAEIYIKAKKQGLSLLHPNFNLNLALIDACKKYGVDPQNMAFNYNTLNKGSFSKIKERTVE